MNKGEFCQLLGHLTSAYRVKLSEDMAAVYYKYLKNYSVKAFEEVTDDWITSNTTYPKINELIIELDKVERLLNVTKLPIRKIVKQIGISETQRQRKGFYTKLLKAQILGYFDSAACCELMELVKQDRFDEVIDQAEKKGDFKWEDIEGESWKNILKNSVKT